jgi:allophanate hydrolase
VWDLPLAALGSFVVSVPPPLAIGTLTLEDGSMVKGFLAEARATRDALDITRFGGWRRFLAEQAEC